MNSLARVLTQKIANDFLTDHEAVAFGQVNQTILHQLLDSSYHIKRRVDYQLIADRSTYSGKFNVANEYRTIARSEMVQFSEEKKNRDELFNTPTSSRPPPISLTFHKVDDDVAVASSMMTKKYRIGSAHKIRLARSCDPRLSITEVWDPLLDCKIDSEDEDEERFYNHEPDDGHVGRPELANFDFLPSSVRQIEVSTTILLSPQGSMATLSHVESITLGALWPWQLASRIVDSYWPPQLKRLKFRVGRWIHPSVENKSDASTGSSTQNGEQFFRTIDIRSIRFPSTLTELELPRGMYSLFNEEESSQLNAIQYPAGLKKLICPFIPRTCEAWHLPESISYLECDFDSDVKDLDFSSWMLPAKLETLVFHDLEQEISALRLPDSLASLTLPYGYTQSLKSVILPASLTKLDCPASCLLPHDWSRTSITEFTVELQENQSFCEFKFPQTVTRIHIQSTSLPRIPSSYVWPHELSKMKLETNFLVDPGQAIMYLSENEDSGVCNLPPTVRRLVIDSSGLQGTPSQLKLNEGLESIQIRTSGQPYAHVSSWSELVLPSTLKEFILQGPSDQLPRFQHLQQLVKLELTAAWDSPIRKDEFILPETLRSLRFGEEFHQPLHQLRLPTGLTELKFGRMFNQSLAPLAGQIPQLRVFTLGDSTRFQSQTAFSQLSSLMNLHLPPSLCQIALPASTELGIVKSSFHTRYKDFIAKLQERVEKVDLLKYCEDGLRKSFM